MNYTFSVSWLCVLYSLSLVSSQRDLPTDGQTTNSPRPRALTPYKSGQTHNPVALNKTADSGSDKDDDDCWVLPEINRSETSENGKQAYPVSPGLSPTSVNGRPPASPSSTRRQNSLTSEPQRSDMPSSPRHRRSPKTAPNTPNASGTILGTLQERRDRDGLPVNSSIEHSNAFIKEPTTPPSNVLSQIPPSIISTFAGATQSVLTQRRNSGSPKNEQPEQVQNVRANASTISSIVAAHAVPHRYQRYETQIENSLACQDSSQTERPTAAQLRFGADFMVPVDLGEKTGPDQHAIALESTLKARPTKPSCFARLCCCCFPCFQAKTKKR